MSIIHNTRSRHKKSKYIICSKIKIHNPCLTSTVIPIVHTCCYVARRHYNPTSCRRPCYITLTTNSSAILLRTRSTHMRTTTTSHYDNPTIEQHGRVKSKARVLNAYLFCLFIILVMALVLLCFCPRVRVYSLVGLGARGPGG